MIKVILWDIDGTLLDFEKAEKQAIRACFEKFQLGECTDEMIARYSVINKGYWENPRWTVLNESNMVMTGYNQRINTLEFKLAYTLRYIKNRK